jgi:hypothetical protein
MRAPFFTGRACLLKYFTVDWWSGLAPEDPLPVYRAYYESARGSLPSDLVTAHDTEPLQDATLHSAELDGSASVLRLKLTVFEETHSRPLTLVYSGVTCFRTLADGSTNHNVFGPNAYGDLGYQEVEVVGAGRFEHRLY